MSCGCNNSNGCNHSSGCTQNSTAYYSGVANCCSPQKLCKTPCTYDTDKIQCECVFLDKVYDSKLSKKEIDKVITQTFDPAIANLNQALKFDNIKTVCDSSKLTITPTIVSVNGQTPTLPSVPGPGGISLVNLGFVNTTQCDEYCQSTPIVIEENLNITGNVLIKISGSAIFGDCTCYSYVPSVCFNSTLSININETITGFSNLCMPSSSGSFKPALGQFSGITCKFILPAGSNNLKVIPDPKDPNKFIIQITGALALCVSSEYKVVIASQICVLAAGNPIIEEDSGLCENAPNLFPYDEEDEDNECEEVCYQPHKSNKHSKR